MIQVKKCQSKKHSMGGCGNPRCPEGLSIEVAMDDAVSRHDLNAFLTARDMVGAEPSYLRIQNGMMSLTLAIEEKFASFRYPANRPEATDHIASIGRTDLRSFDDADEMEDYLNELYRPYARVSIHGYIDKTSGFGLKRLSVADMRVDVDLRGSGIGRHMRATIMKFADENSYVITGTPTESGDGTIEQTNANEEEFKAHALAHKARLVKFYLDSGYEYNYAFTPHGKGDYWTGEPFPPE